MLEGAAATGHGKGVGRLGQDGGQGASAAGERDPLRILLLRPVPSPVGSEGPVRLPTPAFLLPSTLVDVAYCADGPESYEDPADCARATPLIVARARLAETEGYDAMVVSCMLDPGVREARRAVRMPVIGLGSASLAVAGLVGERPDRFFTLDIPVRELHAEGERVFEQLVHVGRMWIRRHGADVLVPNCAQLGHLAESLTRKLGVPVVPNESVGLKVAELIAVFGLRRAGTPMPVTPVRRLRRALHALRWRCRRWLSIATARR